MLREIARHMSRITGRSLGFSERQITILRSTGATEKAITVI
jgi:hypothetical protein